jgi:hypothetical protein
MQQTSSQQAEPNQANVQGAVVKPNLAIAVRAHQLEKGLPDSLIVTLTNTGDRLMEYWGQANGTSNAGSLWERA